MNGLLNFLCPLIRVVFLHLFVFGVCVQDKHPLSDTGIGAVR